MQWDCKQIRDGLKLFVGARTTQKVGFYRGTNGIIRDVPNKNLTGQLLLELCWGHPFPFFPLILPRLDVFWFLALPSQSRPEVFALGVSTEQLQEKLSAALKVPLLGRRTAFFVRKPILSNLDH